MADPVNIIYEPDEIKHAGAKYPPKKYFVIKDGELKGVDKLPVLKGRMQKKEGRFDEETRRIEGYINLFQQDNNPPAGHQPPRENYTRF